MAKEKKHNFIKLKIETVLELDVIDLEADNNNCKTLLKTTILTFFHATDEKQAE